ncbi:MAG: transcription-repair coupling factor [Bacteroides sp.]|nr:transcription-repair coupling factor [Bacteroides sp.]MCM1379349.1 transcription-repair coupling factor [Bacteroides sp.]MCM1445209.1 transcription-repair coupling factor [Prevotella sp.]
MIQLPEDKGRQKALRAALSEARTVSVYGLAGSAAAMMLAQTGRKRPMIVVADSLDDAGYLYHDLTRLCGDDAVAFLPSGYKRHIKYGQTDAPSQILRNEATSRLYAPDTTLRFLVTYPEAMAEKVASPGDMSSHTLHIAVGEKLNLTETLKWLRENGFTEEDYVYEPGHFGVRGSILDIYGYSNELPFRIDLFGNDVDSIRLFNVETQLSEQKLDAIDITANVADQSAGGSLLDFIDPATVIAVRDDVEFLLSRVRAVGEEKFSASAALADEGDANAMKQVIDTEAFCAKVAAMRTLIYSDSDHSAAGCRASLNFNCSPQGIYHKNFDLIGSELSRLQSEGYTIYILSDSAKQHERLRSIFAERGDKVKFTPIIGTLHAGFVDHNTRSCIFTDHQIFDRFHKYSLKSERARSGKLALSLKELSAIEPGDYIVHADHGVGRFAGLVRSAGINGRMQEMIKLTYLNGDTIFVSLHSLHKLSKYRGKEGDEPRINKLGSGAWNKLKERTKSKLKDIARDLISLYSRRRQEQGFEFPPDDYMQHELEASFIYEDTPDQLTATQAVKADMESPRPMDRLICGDVGFGKTEIAMRAAFKAAIAGKQTAVLVPTTVLAYQHFRTFTERFKDFPVRVDYLSRARSPKQVKEILAALEDGKIDVIIGTHKLIGKSVKFHDLGLLVIDEEQKFGVAVKEKLKELKVNVDTLTMSATPIPRTLQFSLMGARDLSAITTPPPNRHPIATQVLTMTDELLAEALNFELSRGGQVFIINNRIEGLYDLENIVRRLVPDARTVVAHGQMPPEKLEKAILDFTARDYDVLIATTIVESGIDMPNVNTMIIYNAQNFGLSELHQLRGRVGRSSRKAFCYLAVPAGAPVSPVARRRLQAIESFSDLGSGIHIAMQDLDIRGAGNLLGAEQSGFIADLGYETYQRILQEAVTELRTEEFAETFADQDEANQDFVADCTIESDMELLLPADYVPQDSERIALYRELDGIDRELDLRAFSERLEDRFGRIPRPAAELLRVPRLRRLARKLGIEKVSLKQGKMFLFFVGSENVAYYQSPMFGKIIEYVTANPRDCQFRERDGRRSIVIANVDSVEHATGILATILS